MGSPYLNSGETIVLTTNRVVVDAIAYDVMLTTARIIFIDNKNPRFEPGESPLSAILSVQGGKTPANDPVITILFRPEEGGGDVRQPQNLVFSQNPGENRKPERDEWVRTIIQHEHCGAGEADRGRNAPDPEPAGDRGLQPAVRRWVAPDRVRPLSNVGHPHRATPASTVVMPDEVEGGGEIQVSASEPQTKAAESTEPEQEPAPAPDSDTATGYTPVSIQRAPPAIRTRIIIPQIIEELLPGRTKPLPLVPDEAAIGKEASIGQTVQDIVPSLKVAEEPAREQPHETETVTPPEPALVPETYPAESFPVRTPVSAVPAAPAAEYSLQEFPSAEDAVRSEEAPASSEPTEREKEIPVTGTFPEPRPDIFEPEISLAGTVAKPSGPEFGFAEDAVLSEETQASSGPTEREREIPVTGIFPEPVPDTVEPEISPPDTVSEPEEPKILESAVLEQAPSPDPEGLPDSGPDAAPETVAATINIPHEPPEVQPAEHLATDRTRISGTDTVIPDEDRGQESTALQVTEILRHEMPGIPEPAMPAAAGEGFPESSVPSSPEISRTSGQEIPGPAEPVPSGDAVPPQAASPAWESTADGIPPAGHPVPPELQRAPGNTFTYAAVLLLIIALVAAGVMLSLPQGLSGNPVIPPAGTVAVPGSRETVNPTAPSDTPVTTIPASSVTPLPVPQDGVWVEVNSTAHYLGRVGNPEQMRQFSGSGNNFYKIPRSDKPVQVSVQKQDNSGARLTVGIYRNGTLISTRSVTMPMGTIDLLIDPVTARAPGLAENDTASGGHAVGRIENY